LTLALAASKEDKAQTLTNKDPESAGILNEERLSRMIELSTTSLHGVEDRIGYWFWARDSDFKSNQDDEEGTESSSVQTLSTDEIIQQAKDAGFTIQDLHQAKDNTWIIKHQGVLCTQRDASEEEQATTLGWTTPTTAQVTMTDDRWCDLHCKGNIFSIQETYVQISSTFLISATITSRWSGAKSWIRGTWIGVKYGGWICMILWWFKFKFTFEY
jgi:hypothetical protein